MTYGELYKFTLNELKDCTDSPSVEAGMLFRHCFGFDRVKISVNSDKSADGEAVELLYKCICKRKKFIPIQYILGESIFYDFDFIVGDGVLIPRPETEILVDEALNFIKESGIANPVVYDLCSGSGCVGISIARLLPYAKVYLFEKSDSALEFIKQNVELNQVTNVQVFKCDIFDGVSSELPLPDVLVSNPPYIPRADIETLQPEVKKEPVMALDGGDDGLDFYRCIRNKWLSEINTSVFFALEFGIYQSDDVLKLFSSVSDDARIIKDFNCIDRVICGNTVK
ncbi:MAG: peptide chain release factor N(5)-glutamine methyltransferase [Clostridia bacterium]|nr:peptide chain release factor N(5)-glutamine methyltransferase [Clostridia bacterium]